MKYTLLFLGMARTGTSTLWYNLNLHPQISATKIKEPIVLKPYLTLNEKTYLNLFEVKKDSKVLVDGSPNPFFYKTFWKVCKEYSFVKDIKCIFCLRDPLIKLYSQINQCFKNYAFKNYQYLFLVDETNIEPDRIKEMLYINDFTMLNTIEKHLSRDQIMLFHLNELQYKRREILDFLEVDFIPGSFLYKNSSKENPCSIKQLKLLYQLKKWFMNNQDELLNISADIKKKVSDKYQIEYPEETYKGIFT